MGRDDQETRSFGPAADFEKTLRQRRSAPARHGIDREVAVVATGAEKTRRPRGDRERAYGRVAERDGAAQTKPERPGAFGGGAAQERGTGSHAERVIANWHLVGGYGRQLSLLQRPLGGNVGAVPQRGGGSRLDGGSAPR